MSTETPPPDDSDEQRQEKRRYHQQYWSQYKKTRRRVSGTLTADQHAAIEQRAKDAGRAVWKQIHAEAEAYARGEYLPPKDIEAHITELIIQLRRIGTNVNQITREFHQEGIHDEPDLLRNLNELEMLVRAFVKKPWGNISGNSPPDDDDAET